MSERPKKAWRFGVEPKPHAADCTVHSQAAMVMPQCSCGVIEDYRRRLNDALIANGQAPYIDDAGGGP